MRELPRLAKMSGLLIEEAMADGHVFALWRIIGQDKGTTIATPAQLCNRKTKQNKTNPSSSHPSALVPRKTTMAGVQDKELASPDPLDLIPPLKTQILTSASDKISALKLVADSIAQQRQVAATAVIFHPFIIAVYIVILAITSQLIYKTRSDIPVIVTTCAGVTMTLLVAVRACVGGYIVQAEEFASSFIEEGERDIILIGSRYGEVLIGALILEIERQEGRKGKLNGGKGVVRAWTTKRMYRGAGVGTELLEEAVRTTREKLGDSSEIGFATKHANSKMVLPDMFNSRFRERECRAARALKIVIKDVIVSSRKS